MMKKVFLSLACFLGFQVCSQPMRILFIGNSYTHFNEMPNILQNLTEQKGLKVDIQMSAVSNQTLKMQSERPELFEKINSQKWDYVILQGFSREMAFDKAYIDTNVVPYVNVIVDSIYSRNSCANVLFYQTWGYDGGFHADSMDWSFQQMSDQIQQGYLYLASKFDLPIVPVGKVWETVKENHPDINLYQDDHQHPSLFGSYLTACSFYVSLFKTHPEVEYYAGLEKSKAELLQNSAFDFINSNLNRYKLSEKTLVLTKFKADNTGGIKGTASYPSANSIIWDFGDGVTFEGSKVKHTYKKKGTYTIVITILDECGKRVIRRKVQI